MKHSTVLWNCNLFKTVHDSAMRAAMMALLVRAKRIANRHPGNPTMIKADIS